MRRASLLLGLLLAGAAAAIFAGSSASRSVAVEQPAWFKIAITATPTSDVDGYLRGSTGHLRDSLQGRESPLAGYVRVQAIVENVGTIAHTGTVAVTLAHPTGELTRVFAEKVTLAAAPEFLRGLPAFAKPTSVTYSAAVPCDCPGEHSAMVVSTHVMQPGDPTVMRDAVPATATATAMVR